MPYRNSIKLLAQLQLLLFLAIAFEFCFELLADAEINTEASSIFLSLYWAPLFHMAFNKIADETNDLFTPGNGNNIAFYIWFIAFHAAELALVTVLAGITVALSSTFTDFHFARETLSFHALAFLLFALSHIGIWSSLGTLFPALIHDRGTGFKEALGRAKHTFGPIMSKMLIGPIPLLILTTSARTILENYGIIAKSLVGGETLEIFLRFLMLSISLIIYGLAIVMTAYILSDAYSRSINKRKLVAPN